MEGKDIFTLIANPFTERQLPSLLTDQQHIDLRVDPAQGIQRLWRGLREHGIEKSDVRDWNMRDAPYPGLLAFEERHAAIFFGREKEINEGLELLNRVHRLAHPPIVLVLGASGSGKSSLIRAGLIPQMRRDPNNWTLVGPFRPGHDPVREFGFALERAFPESSLRPAAEADRMRTAIERTVKERSADALLAVLSDLRSRAALSQSRVLLIVDQFEELLGHKSSEHPANQFLSTLREVLTAPDGPVFLLAAIRSDYLNTLQQSTSFFGVEFKSLPLGPLPVRAMRQIIEEPAKLGAIELEIGLTEELLRDTGTSYALPLLAFTLRMLWDRYHERKRFEIRDYEALGRLQGAVAQEAEAVLEGALRLGDEDDLRRAFLRMARLTDDGTAFARQPVQWKAFPERVYPMLRHFVDHRLLLTRGDGTIEVSHEALFRSWERLSLWLNQDHEFLLWQNRLRNALGEWTRIGQEDGALLHGKALTEAERWLNERRSEIASFECDFIARSQQLKIREERESHRMRSSANARGKRR
jgi:hypothetical protein